jgi:type VI secretion system protein ImpF
MKGPEKVARLSVLDRLILGGQPVPRTVSESTAAVKDAVLRDIEWLLNTRETSAKAPDELTELQNSVYTFGLPDISSMSGDSERARRELVRKVQERLERFEPRLSSVRVTEAENVGQSRQVRFNVEALLRMDLAMEPIYFHTVLDPVSGRFNVPKAG